MQNLNSINSVWQELSTCGYICNHPLARVILLSLSLCRPFFLEGEEGVGKTEIAKALATVLDRRLIRLQCYKGLDAAIAVYECNFPAQMIAIRTAEASGETDRKGLQPELYSKDFLIRRPLLEAMQPDERGTSFIDRRIRSNR